MCVCVRVNFGLKNETVNFSRKPSQYFIHSRYIRVIRIYIVVPADSDVIKSLSAYPNQQQNSKQHSTIHIKKGVIIIEVDVRFDFSRSIRFDKYVKCSRIRSYSNLSLIIENIFMFIAISSKKCITHLSPCPYLFHSCILRCAANS